MIMSVLKLYYILLTVQFICKRASVIGCDSCRVVLFVMSDDPRGDHKCRQRCSVFAAASWQGKTQLSIVFSTSTELAGESSRNNPLYWKSSGNPSPSTVEHILTLCSVYKNIKRKISYF